MAGGYTGAGGQGEGHVEIGSDLGAWRDVGHLARRGRCRDDPDRRRARSSNSAPRPTAPIPPAERERSCARPSASGPAIRGSRPRPRWSKPPMPSCCPLSGRRDRRAFTARRWRMTRAGAARIRPATGAILAEVLGLPVVWDFRTRRCARWAGRARRSRRSSTSPARAGSGATEPLAFLNLGGVGNLTWVDPPPAGAREHPARLPGLRHRPGQCAGQRPDARPPGPAQDEGGALAAAGTRGRGDSGRSSSQHPYFFKMPPKSLDRNDFHGLARCGRAPCPTPMPPPP